MVNSLALGFAQAMKSEDFFKLTRVCVCVERSKNPDPRVRNSDFIHSRELDHIVLIVNQNN